METSSDTVFSMSPGVGIAVFIGLIAVWGVAVAGKVWSGAPAALVAISNRLLKHLVVMLIASGFLLAAGVAIALKEIVKEEDPGQKWFEITADALVPQSELDSMRSRVSRVPLSESVILEIGVSNVDTGRPVVYGGTNLPDGTGLLVTVQSKEPGFTGQSRASAKDGVFMSERFGPEKGLGDGCYRAIVMMASPEDQPDYVKKLMGLKDDGLDRKHVTKESLEKIVRTSIVFCLGEVPRAGAAQ